MAVERLDLTDGQWVEMERRPTHGVIRKIARETQRVSRGPDPLEAEDILVSNLVSAWSVVDEHGSPLSFQRTDFDKVPNDTWAQIVSACTDVLEAAVPNSQTRRF